MAFDVLGRPPAETPIKDPVIRPFRDFGGLSLLAATDTIQRAIDWSASLNDTDGEANVAVGQPGIFQVDTLVIRHGTRLVNPGRTATLIKPISGGTAPALITLDAGPVQKVEISGFTIDMSDNPTQHAIYFKAVTIFIDGADQGGLWHARFKDLWIRGGEGESLWLRGGGDALNAPHQFIKLESVVVESASTTRAALRFTGQVGQLQADAACRFDGIGRTTTGVNIIVERTVDDAGVNNGDAMPYSLLLPVTCQSRKRLVNVERGLDISFDGAHFEEGEEGVNVDVSSGLTSVVGAYFGNVGHNAGGTGFAARIDNGNLVVGRNFFAGTVDTHYARRFGGQLIPLGGDVDATGIRTAGASINIATAATIDTGTFKTVFVNGGSATNIATITSQLGPGEYLSLRANGGRVRFATGGNIDLGGAFDPFILPSGATLTLVRNDLVGVWQIVGVSGPRGAYYGLPVFVDVSMSPYQILPDTDAVRVDASGGVVTLKLASKNDVPPAKEVLVKKLDSSANQVRVNGATTAENPDGQADNVVRLVDQTQAMTFRRNGLVGSGGWDTVSSVSARSGAPGVGALLTFGTHLTGTSYDGSSPVTIATDATAANTASTIVARGTQGEIATGPATFTATGGNIAVTTKSANNDLQWGILNGAGALRWGWYIPSSGTELILANYNLSGATTFTVNGADNTVTFAGNGAGFTIGSRTGAARIQYGTVFGTAFSLFTASNTYASLDVGSVTFNSLGVGVVAGTMYFDSSQGGVTTIAKTGTNYDWSVWDPTGAAALLAIVTGTTNVRIANDLILGNTGGRGIVVSGTRRVTVTTTGVDVTGTFTTSGTANFISGVLVVSSTGFGTTKPIAVTTAVSGSGLDIADSTGNTGMSFTPATSGDSTVLDNRRVGSQTVFRNSNASSADRTWLTATAAGAVTFGFAVTFSSTISVSGTATMAGATFSAGVTFNSTALFNGVASFTTIGTDLVPATSGVRDLGGGANKWRDYYSNGKIEIGTTIKTGAPSGGTANTWRFGDYITAAVTLDTAHYAEVEIGGALRKVALVT